jgi:uncharacterized membrane protein (DUF441 family)
MKMNSLYLIITILISGLLAWGGYALSNDIDRKFYVIVALFVSLCVSSICGLAIQYKEKRSGVMIRTVCWIIFLMALIMDYVFSFFHFNIPLFIICNGLIILITILIVSSIHKTEM